MRLQIHLFLDALCDWISLWSALPGVTVTPYAVVRSRWTEIAPTDYEASLTEADTASVISAAHEWLVDARPRGERHVIHCFAGSTTRLTSKFKPGEISASFRSLCPPGPTYLTASGLGLMLAPYIKSCGWEDHGVLSIGNDPQKIKAAGEIWAKRWELLQTTLNPEMGGMLLHLRKPDVAHVFPSLTDYYPPGGTPMDLDSKWAELESTLKTHDWAYSYADDPRKYRAGAKSASTIEVLMRQLTTVDRARALELYTRLGGTPSAS
jgi:hypothetical protein